MSDGLIKALRKAVLASALVAIASLLPQAALWADSDGQFLDGMRQRRLFSLVEAHCRERLRDNSLTEAQRADLTTELIRGHAYHAINLPGSRRALQWEKAHEVADDFLRRHASSPRAMLVRIQKGLTHLAHGELLRQELEADAGRAGTRDLALQELRQAAKQLEAIDEDIARELPRLNGREPAEGELTYGELFSLQNNLRFQLARVYRNRALCYAKGSADRIDALSRSIEQHQSLLRRLPDEDPLRWDVELERIACERGLDHLDAARQKLIGLQSEPMPENVVLRARTEALRLELAAGRPERALGIARLGREVNGRAYPDLDFAILETYNAFADSAKSKKEAAQWRDKSVELQRVIEQLHGPYWGRRATLLVVRSAAESGDVDNLEVLVKLAEEAWRKQNFDDAVRAFEQAGVQAKQIGEDQQAFVLHYKAALVEQERKHYSEAALRLRRLATGMKTHSQASQAHLLAAWDAAQLVRNDEAALPEYVELLEEHLATWPNERPADTARQWLAMLREHEQAWNEAVDIYLETSPASDLFTEAVKRAGNCALRQLEQLKASSEPIEAQAEVFAERLEELIYDEQEQLPQGWDGAKRSAALSASKLRLQYANKGHAKASEYLQSALDGSPDADQSWKSAVSSLLVVALAGQRGRSDEARKVLEQIAGGSPAELFQMTLALSPIRDASQSTSKVDIARLQLKAIDLLAGKALQFDPAQQQRLAHIRAEALGATGNRKEAADAYKQLAAANPNNGPIQTEYGDLLLSGNDKSSLEDALRQWRVIGNRSKPRSDRWYQSKYNIALAQYNLSKLLRPKAPDRANEYRDRSAQMLRFLKDTPPGWEQSRLKADFERLLQLCSQ